MSKFRSIPYAVLSAVLLTGGSAYAQSMYSIDQRQDYQQNRIEQGIRSGQISRGEAYRLEQGERAIDRAQARARADGTISQQERNRIDHMVDRQGRSIYQQSHDRQQAWDHGQNWGRTDGRRDGWNDRQYGDGHNRDGWGNNHNYSGGDRGNHTGWDRGQHNGWTGNRPPGFDHRQASNGGTHDWRQHDRPQQPTTGQPTHSWGNGGWQRPQPPQQPQTAQPATQPTRSWQRPQAQPTQPAAQASSGWRMQQASATPAQRPTFTRTSNPTGSRPRGDRR